VAALEADDQASAQANVESLRGLLGQARAASGDNGLYAAIAVALGSQDGDVLATLQDSIDRAEGDDREQALAAAREFEEAANSLEAGIAEAQRLEPELLVKPFGVEVTQLNDISSEPGAYYSPGTLIVLVQHLAVTFAALSLVRERQIGLTDVFRVSPLSPAEAVTGKYLGFGTISVGVAVILSAAMWLFGVQVRGSLAQYFVVIVAVILASLGLGFTLSGLSRTDTQAVQYSMMVLLVSIFFTGFVLPLDRLAGPVQVISYLIPATYGIRAIHDVVFRGAAVDPLVLAGLLAYALALAAAAWWAVRRDVELVRA
jgi:ABC-2 type transport system permease protein